MREEKIKLLNQSIKHELKCLTTFKNGNFLFKEELVKECQRSIKFLNEMKKKVK